MRYLGIVEGGRKDIRGSVLLFLQLTRFFGFLLSDSVEELFLIISSRCSTPLILAKASSEATMSRF